MQLFDCLGYNENAFTRWHNGENAKKNYETTGDASFMAWNFNGSDADKEFMLTAFSA